MNNKIIAIMSVVIVAIAGAAVAVVMLDDDDGGKGGLYSLNAKILNVDMGGMSSTPKMVDTLEYMYSEVYGDLAAGAKNLTLDDAKEDAAFWNKYCKYDSLVTVNDDGTMSYKTVLDSSGTLQTVNISGFGDKLISTGTAYPTILYYAMCYKYGVTPFSEEAYSNVNLLNEFRSINYSGLIISSIGTSTPELVKYYGPDYIERCKSLNDYDFEAIAEDVKNAKVGGHSVILMGSGTIAKDKNATINAKVTGAGGVMALNSATSIPSTFAGIELVCTLFGYSDYVDDILNDLELRLYKIYWSAQKSDYTHKAYFEGSSGKASKSTGSGHELCKFMGWDVSMFTGAEIDTETILSEKPDIMIYYTNDERSMDVKMRVAS